MSDEDNYQEPDNRQRVDLSELGLAISLPTQEQIVEAIAHQYVRDYSSSKALRDQVAVRIGELIRESIDTVALEHIRSILFRPVQLADTLGNPIGEPIAMNAMILEQVKAWQTEDVDPYNGKPGKKTDYNNSNYISRSAYLLRSLASADLKKQVDAAVAEVKAQAKAVLDTRMKDAIAGAIGALSR